MLFDDVVVEAAPIVRPASNAFLEPLMRQPWDRPELVREGDADPHHTYMSVGRILSQWEGVEIQLGYIYTAARGDHGDWSTLLQYGKGSTTSQRVGILQAAVDAFFVKNCNQEAEGRIACFLFQVGEYAARRHDLAHGIVRDHTWARWRIPPDPRDAIGYFLLPSHYKGNAFDDSALPIYAYTTQSMENLRHHLIMLETEAMGMAQMLNRLASGATR